MEVFDEVILFRIGVRTVMISDSVNTVVLIVMEQDIAGNKLLSNQSVAVVVVIVVLVVGTLEGTESVGIVLTGEQLRTDETADKLTLIVPCEPIGLVAVVVGGRQSRSGITVGDSRTVYGNETVTPTGCGVTYPPLARGIKLLPQKIFFFHEGNTIVEILVIPINRIVVRVPLYFF